MSKKPWMKFYPTDWQSDPKLRTCSLAARGLWIEMLCIMHEAEGDLAVNGKALAARQIALLCGAEVGEVGALIAELKAADVVSERRGLLYSRRMRRDCTKAAKNRTNGKLGGNPRLLEDEPCPEDERINVPSLKPALKAQSPEARVPETRLRESRVSESELPDPGAAEPRPLKARLFGPALEWLAEQSGRPQDKLRGLVGKWCRDHGDGAVLEAFERCARAAPVDPVPWLERALTAAGEEADGAVRQARGLADLRATLAAADACDGHAS